MLSLLRKPLAPLLPYFLLLLPLHAPALERDLTNAAETVAGLYSSIYLHEAGHALVLKLAGAEGIRIQVPRPGTVMGGVTSAETAVRLSDGTRQVVAASGLVAANLAGELVLQRRGLHGSVYGQSLLGTALVSNLVHLARYYGKVRGVGGWQGNDIDAFELAGGNPHLLSAALLGYTAWTLQRMRREEVPLFFVNLKF